MIKNNGGSILLWSIFLMILISSSFIYVSVGIKSQIDSSKFLTNLVDNYNIKNKKIEGGEYSYSDSEKFKVLYYDSFTGSLKSGETLVFENLNNNTGSLKINSGGPIYVEIFTGSTIYGSGVVHNNATLSLNGNLSLMNLGGYSNYSISFSNTGIIFPYNYYQIEKYVGGTTIIKEFGKY